MTISSTDDPRAGPFNGNGSQTVFPFVFKTFDEADLLVVRTDEDGLEYTLVLDSDYSVSLNVDQDANPGGSVTYPISGSALLLGETLTIASNLDYTQTTDIQNAGGFFAQVIEDALDRNVMLVKQVNEKVDRAVQVSVSTPDDVSVVLPVPVADKVIGWNDTATGLVNRDITDFATVVAFAAWQSQTFDGDGVTTQFTLSSDPGNINNLDIIIGGVGQRPTLDYTLNGTTLTFGTAPVAGTDNISVRWGQALPQGTATAGQTSIADVGGYYTATNVETALQEIGAREALTIKANVIADGVTNQTAEMIAAISAATALVPCTLELPRGVIYCATSLGNLAVNGLTIRGKGLLETTLKFGHAGVAMLADAFASGSPSDPFVRTNFLDFTIQGNAGTTHIFQAQGLARSEINLNAKEAEPTAGIAYHLKGVMLSDIRLRCSTDINAMVSVPYEGVRMEAGTRAGSSVGNCSNNVITSPRFVGLSIGERLTGADQNTFIGGAAESNSVYGLLIGSGCRYNTFIGHGLENPSASSADLADAGESTTVLNGYSAKKVLLQGRNGRIDGGFYERIEVQAGAAKNVVEGVRLNNWRTGSGGFFDAGTSTRVARLYGTTLTATFATSVMTVTAVAQGVLAVGQVVVANGVTTGTTITSFGTGTGGTGTYNLSTTPGTLSSRAVSTLADVEYLSDRAGITVGASPFEWKNTTGRYVEVVIQSGTVTQVRGMRGTDTWLRPTAVPGIHLVAPGDRLEISYSALPGVSYVPHNSLQG